MNIKLISAVTFFTAMIQLCFSKNIKSNEGRYILTPCQLLNNKQPEANWIWESGELDTKNYHLNKLSKPSPPEY